MRKSSSGLRGLIPVLALAVPLACFGETRDSLDGEVLGTAPLEDPEAGRIAELDAYWSEVSRAVKSGDFEAYKATCHPAAVLVSGVKEISYPLTQALARWKAEFDDTRAGKLEASVEFRFSHRYGDAATAHEAGVFRYAQSEPGEEAKPEYIAFEGLLVKEDGAWKIMMEYQKQVVTRADWDELAPGG